ncbi:MAG: EamA family transporter [Bacteroidaceae bacterium]|nr:EamA family transporter [Bacteroidaceae bacterium]MBQ5705945.1 EamA family transporter [Bacteroidaceae bacterium]MBQ5817711.1 EamA family transporter [Bacteroidaceae bacterium]
MWVALAFLSAALLGCYDFFKKVSLKENAVIPVLFLNTLFSALIFAPFILLSRTGQISSEALFVPVADLHTHMLLAIKAVIVLSSWMCGYFAMKHLPITIVSPIQATRPVMVLLGALLIFGEQLNVCQWIGVSVAILSFFLLSKSGKKEGIDFKHNRWVALVVAAAMLGAISALYDKYLMRSLAPMLVQSWFNLYQCLMMAAIMLFLWWPTRSKSAPFKWRWSIPLISVFLGIADFCYFSALAQEDALIAVVSMIRRGSVIVSFAFGAMILREKNLKSKVFDLILILIGLFFLYLGSK